MVRSWRQLVRLIETSLGKYGCILSSHRAYKGTRKIWRHLAHLLLINVQGDVWRCLVHPLLMKVVRNVWRCFVLPLLMKVAGKELMCLALPSLLFVVVGKLWGKHEGTLLCLPSCIHAEAAYRGGAGHHVCGILLRSSSTSDVGVHHPPVCS
eukprot:scaffold211898_cov18-Tisochrysis_lutea.AAC.2